jgi:tRNA pseudouridine55 synthase
MEVGRALGCGAYLTALRRTAVGPFTLADACTLEDLEAAGPEIARQRLLPVAVLVEGLPRLDCPEAEALWFTQGREIAAPLLPAGAEVAVFGPAGRFLGVGSTDGGRRLLPMRLMATGAGGEAP